MKAVRLHEYGGLDSVLYEDAPRPEPRDGDVVIRVLAAAVNPFDWYVCLGLVRGFIDFELPVILGWDVAGVVDALGSNVQGLAVGDEVYGQSDTTRDGVFAEYAAVPAARLVTKPAFLDHIDVAALPNAALAAWDGLFSPISGLDLAPGQAVLIHGAAGGVGTLAVQLAKWRGAKVIATASRSNQEFLRELGADDVIDYTTQRFEDVVTGVDGVLNTVGGELESRSYTVLRPGGVYASLASVTKPDEAQARGIRAVGVRGLNSLGAFGDIARLVEEKVLRPVVSKVRPLSQAREALEESQTRHVRGKLVLRMTKE